jgi:predicted metalloprotease
LLPLGLALLVAACGSAGNPSTAGHELDRLTRQVAPATTRLPAPPTTTSVERAYIRAVFDNAQAFWYREFTAAHLRYPAARVVVFWSQTRSGCGAHDSGGSFYCPSDDGVYLDLSGSCAIAASGRPLRGTSSGMRSHIMFSGSSGSPVTSTQPIGRIRKGRTGRTVLVELQADCLAGVWAHAAFPRSGLTVADLDHPRKLAELIGDDYLAQAAGEVVDKPLWTHGSSQQRQHWLRTGFQSGRPNACDTFASKQS